MFKTFLAASPKTETDKLVREFIVQKVKDLKFENNFKKTCEFINRENPINCKNYFEKMKKLYSKSDKSEELNGLVPSDFVKPKTKKTKRLLK